ncbi:MAG: 7-carboxy-7-deazaguanine synthase QueE [Leptospira sp.]|nr:7-carboxy-7-deazaguanine synthase QueE [Leptospira sp.]
MFGKVHEIYSSISGEGISQGIPTVFVRFAGCSLRCGKTQDRKLWCDTPYALGPNQGEENSISEILNQIKILDPNQQYQILCTGGEPLEGENGKKTYVLANEVFQIRTANYRPYPRIRIETNGKEKLSLNEPVVYTMDYKLPGSGMESEMNFENFFILEKRHNSLDEIKFVVRDRIDFQRSLEVISENKINLNLLYSPVHEELDARELIEWLKKETPPNARLSLQLHKYLWGNQKGV